MKKFFVFAVMVLAFASFINAETVIGFDEALKTSFEKNENLKKAASDLKISEAVVEKTYSQFDLFFKGGVNYSESKAEPSSPFSPDRTKVLAYSAGFSNKLPIGGFLSLDFTSTRLSMFYPDMGFSIPGLDPSLFTGPYNPSYTPKLSINYVQPLLKDFWGRPDEKAIKIGEYSVALSRSGLKNAVLDHVGQMKDAYYFIYMAQKLLEIQKGFLEDSQKFYDETVKLKKIGLREERDVLQTRASLLNSQAEITPAENNVKLAKENFLSFAGYQVSEWDGINVTVTDTVEAVSIPEALTEELENTLTEIQPAVVIAKTAMEMAKTGKEIAEISALPSLNLIGNYTMEASDGQLEQAYDKFDNNNYNSFMAGVQFSYSFPNRGGRGDVDDKTEGYKKASEQYEFLKRMMKIQIRSAYRKLLTAKSDYDLKKEAAELQQKRLKIEQSNFSSGRISTRELLGTQMEYHTSRIKETAAFYEYVKAVATWNKISGKYDGFYNSLTEGAAK